MSSLRKMFAFAAALLWSLAAHAGTLPYSQAAFDKAVAAGEPVVVQFHADWCPTCRAQAPLVSKVLAEDRMKPIQFFVADFDKEKALKQSLKVTTQSTFVAFKGGKETGRSTGQTSLGAVEAVFAKAL